MVRVWLTVIIRRIAIIGLLLTLSLGIGLVWRCYAAEGNVGQQSIGGLYNITATQNAGTITLTLDHILTDIPSRAVVKPASVSANYLRITCKVTNIDNGYEGTVQTINASPSTSLPDVQLGGYNLKTWVNNIQITELYHHDIQRISPVRTAYTYTITFSCVTSRSKRTTCTSGSCQYYNVAVGEYDIGKQSFQIITTSPANLDPPFRTTLSSGVLYLPGHHVTYTVPVYDETDYYDNYSVIANPSAITALHFSATQGIFASSAGENEPNCSTEDRLNQQVPVTSGSTFSIEACRTTPAIRAAADINDEIIYTSPIYILSLIHI